MTSLISIGLDELRIIEKKSVLKNYRINGFNLLAKVCEKHIISMEFGGTGADGTPDNLLLTSNFSTFAAKIYTELIKVRAGETITYSELAARCGVPSATRAVANCIARNNFAIAIPCHRVVPKSGGTGKYKWGRQLKALILEKESIDRNV